MNTSKLRSKRVVVPAIAAAAALAVAGPVWAATTSDDPQGSERDRVAAAATEALGGGAVLDVETSDDHGEAYEVEVRTDKGQQIDVHLDNDLEVVSQETEAEDSDHDERALTASERAQAGKAALAAVGSGTVLDAEASDDKGVSYEVEVRAADNAEWDVDLDAEFAVVDKRIDD